MSKLKLELCKVDFCMLSMTALQHVLFLQLLVILVYFYEMDWFCLADFL